MCDCVSDVQVHVMPYYDVKCTLSPPPGMAQGRGGGIRDTTATSRLAELAGGGGPNDKSIGRHAFILRRRLTVQNIHECITASETAQVGSASLLRGLVRATSFLWLMTKK